MTGLPGYAEGAFWVQDAAAAIPARLLNVQPGERVLDLCAAPGGKTAVIAEAGARVTACDISEQRLARLGETVDRMGVSAFVESTLVDPDSPAPSGPFDAVLVDAPCSNTGVLGARPGARWRWGPASNKSLGEVQRALLERAAQVVRPGGRLIWSTCSLEPGENEQRVASFLRSHVGWSLQEDHLTVPTDAEAGGSVDGGYAARMLAP